MSADIVSVASLSAAERTLWRAWCDEQGLSPFHRPEFAAIAEAIAPGAALAVFHRGGRPCGFFPFQRRGGAVYPLGAPLNDYHGVVSPAGERWSPADLSRRLAASRLGVTGWIGPDSPGQGVRRAALRADLRDGWDSYLGQRRTQFPRFFRDKARVRRALARDAGPVAFESDCRDGAVFDWLIAHKRAQYARTGRHDIFQCGWTQDLLRALWAAETPGFGARLAVLQAGGRVWAAELSVHAGDQYHFWIPAYEPEGRRFSPGLILCLDTLQAACAAGFNIFDFGFEGEAYKKYFAEPYAEVLQGLVFADGRPAWRDAAAGVVGAVGVAKVEHRWLAIEASETTRARRWAALAAAVGRSAFN